MLSDVLVLLLLLLMFRVCSGRDKSGGLSESDLAIDHARVDRFDFVFAELEVEQELQGDEHLDAVEEDDEETPLPIVRIVIAVEIVQL